MTPRILTLSVAILFAAVLLVAACSAGTTKAPSSMSMTSMSMTAAPTGPTIGIANMKFTSPASVPPGAKVTVTNSDGVEHTVTADSGKAFDVEVDENGTATFTAPNQPGTYAYHCTYHPMMHGQLVVA